MLEGMKGRVTRRDVLRASGIAGMGLAGAALVGCGGDDTSSTATPGGGDGATATGSGTPGAGGLTDATIRVGQRRGFDYVDPTRASGTLYGRHTNILESLTQRAIDGSIDAGLATEWEFDEDGLGITWTLREGVVHHNGDPFTADDVLFTWEAFGAERSTSSYFPQFDRVVEVTAPSSHEVHMKFDSFFFEIPNYMEMGFAMLPKAYVEEVGWETFDREPVGTGPLRAVQLASGGDWHLERFEDYWGPKAPFKNLEILAITEPTARIAALRAGDVDIIEQVFPHQISELEGVSDIEVKSFPSILAQGLGLNLTDPGPLQDVRVRRALNLAIDRQAIVDIVFAGHAKAASTACPPGVAVGCPADVDPYPYDPEEARRLLEEAGYGDGVTLERGFVIRQDTLYVNQVIDLVRQYFEDIGVQTTFELVPFAVQTERTQAGNIDGNFLHSQNITYDASFDLIRHYGSPSSTALIQDPEWRARVEEAVGQQPDSARIAAVEALMREFEMEEAANVVLYYPEYIWAYRTDRVAAFEQPNGWSVYLRNYHLMELA